MLYLLSDFDNFDKISMILLIKLKIFSFLFLYLFNEFKYEINHCSNKGLRKLSNQAYEDVQLRYPRAVYVLYTQIGEDAFKWYDQGGIPYLKEECHRQKGRLIWYCQYLEEAE